MRQDSVSPRRPPDLDDFCRDLAEVAHLPPGAVFEGALLVDDLGLDELGLFAVVAWLRLQAVGFDLPEQMDLRHATVRDAHWYLERYLVFGP